MDIEVLPATEADMDEIMDVQFEGFKGDPYLFALYPGDHSLATVRHNAAQSEIKQWREHFETTHLLKCVDKASGSITAYAKYRIFKHERPESEWKKRPDITWHEGRQKEIAEKFLYSSLAHREKLIGGQPHVLLEILVARPEKQRKGAGTLLVRWGTDKADELGLPAFVCASPAGRPLYAKLGYQQIDAWAVKPEEWDGDHDRVFVEMKRGPQKQAT